MGYFISSLEELLPKKTGKELFDAHEFFLLKKIRRTQWQSNVQKLLSQIHFFFFFKFKNNSPTTHLLISEVQFLTRLILQEALSQYIQGHDKRHYQVQSFEHKT